jgi:twinkle protein
MKTDKDLAKEKGVTTESFIELPQYTTVREVRGISVKTQQLYSVGLTEDALILPYYSVGGLVAYKEYKMKLKNGKKDMFFVGDFKRVTLFGIQTVNTKRQVLIITEGEIDAMSAYEMTGYACVSVPTGADGALKAIKSNLKFIESFPKVIVCFDNDKAGNDAATEVMDLLRSGSSARATLRLKDANEYLKQGLDKEFKETIGNASCKVTECLYTEGEVKELVDRIINHDFKVVTGLDTGITPLSGLKLREEEVTTIFSDPAVGKSSICRQMVANLIHQKINVLLFCYEESDETYIEKTLDMFYHTRLQAKEKKQLEHQINEVFTPYIHLAKVYDDNLDNIREAIEYAVRVHDVKLVVFDNVSAATACSGDSANRIGAVYMTLTELGKKYKHHTIVVSHTRRQPPKLRKQGKDDDDEEDETKIPSLTDGLGSGGIERYSYNVIAAARDSGSNTSRLAIRKNRTRGDLWEFTLTWDSSCNSFKEVTNYASTESTVQSSKGKTSTGDGLLVGGIIPENTTTINDTSTVKETTRDIHSYDF